MQDKRKAILVHLLQDLVAAHPRGSKEAPANASHGTQQNRQKPPTGWCRASGHARFLFRRWILYPVPSRHSGSCFLSPPSSPFLFPVLRAFQFSLALGFEPSGCLAQGLYPDPPSFSPPPFQSPAASKDEQSHLIPSAWLIPLNEATSHIIAHW